MNKFNSYAQLHSVDGILGAGHERVLACGKREKPVLLSSLPYVTATQSKQAMGVQKRNGMW